MSLDQLAILDTLGKLLQSRDLLELGYAHTF